MHKDDEIYGRQLSVTNDPLETFDSHAYSDSEYLYDQSDRV